MKRGGGRADLILRLPLPREGPIIFRFVGSRRRGTQGAICYLAWACFLRAILPQDGSYVYERIANEKFGIEARRIALYSAQVVPEDREPGFAK